MLKNRKKKKSILVNFGWRTEEQSWLVTHIWLKLLCIKIKYPSSVCLVPLNSKPIVATHIETKPPIFCHRGGVEKKSRCLAFGIWQFKCPMYQFSCGQNHQYPHLWMYHINSQSFQSLGPWSAVLLVFLLHILNIQLLETLIKQLLFISQLHTFQILLTCLVSGNFSLTVLFLWVYTLHLLSFQWGEIWDKYLNKNKSKLSKQL